MNKKITATNKQEINPKGSATNYAVKARHLKQRALNAKKQVVRDRGKTTK